MKNLFSFLLCLTIILPVIAQDELVANRTEEEVIIDGIANEWKHKFNVGEDGKLAFAISNDSKFLYLCIQSLDRTIQQKITRSGMVVNLRSKGKNNIKATINYPLKSNLTLENNAPISIGQNPGTQPNRQEMRQQVLDRCVEMKVKGLRSQKGKVPSKNENGLNAAIKWEAEQLLSYELSIPLTELFAESHTEGDLNIPLTLKLTVNALPEPQRPSTGAGGGRGGSRGGGGRGGGMPPAGSGQSTQGSMYNTTTLKQVFLLNTGK